MVINIGTHTFIYSNSDFDRPRDTRDNIIILLTWLENLLQIMWSRESLITDKNLKIWV